MSRIEQTVQILEAYFVNNRSILPEDVPALVKMTYDSIPEDRPIATGSPSDASASSEDKRVSHASDHRDDDRDGNEIEDKNELEAEPA
jgi:hypothetical protein